MQKSGGGRGLGIAGGMTGGWRGWSRGDPRERSGGRWEQRGRAGSSRASQATARSLDFVVD